MEKLSPVIWYCAGYSLGVTIFSYFQLVRVIGRTFLVVIVGPFDALISSICILFYANLNNLFLVLLRFRLLLWLLVLMLLLLYSLHICVYVCVCFPFGKARHKQRVQMKSSSQCRRHYWWRVFVSICCTILFTHSPSSIYLDKLAEWVVSRVYGVVTRLGKLPVQHWDTRLNPDDKVGWTFEL